MYASTEAVTPQRSSDGLVNLQSSRAVVGCSERLPLITPDSILNYLGFGSFQVLAFLLVGLTLFAYGFDGSVLIFIGPSVQEQWNLTTVQYSILPATTAVPNIIGALLFSFISDRYGRVWPFALVLTLCGVFSIASAFANSFALLIVLRDLVSFSIGGIPVTVIPTLMEFLPVRNRAKAVVLTYVIANIGMCVACGLTWWLVPTFSSRGWRYFIIAGAIPALMAALFRLLFIFESPRYLVAMERYELAWNVFKTIARFNKKSLTDFTSREEFVPQFTTAKPKDRLNPRFAFKEIIAMFRPSLYLRTTLALSVVIMAESCGYLGASVFLPDFLNGLPGVNTYFTLLVSLAAQIPGQLLMSIVVEWPKIGRLNSLRIFSVMTALFYFLLALVQTVVSIPVLLVLLYFSSAPILSLIYAYISEIYPTRIRSFSTAYFYILQAIAYATGSSLGAYASVARSPWLFPAIWAGIFAVQFLAALVLNYESYGKNLTDVTMSRNR